MPGSTHPILDLTTYWVSQHVNVEYLIIIPNMKELKVSLSDFELQNF